HQICLNALCELLEVSRSCPAAAWATGYLRHEASNAERLKNLLRAANLLCTISARCGGQGDADGVADSRQKQRGEAGGGCDNSLHAHTRFCEPKVQGIVAAPG